MRYLRLWLQFLKMSWMADMEYRLNFVVRIVGEFVWYTAQLSVFEVLYTHTPNLNGWTIQDIRVFMATLFLSDVIYMIFVQENMDNLSQLVRRGELDLYLVKPVSSQFMVSFRKINTSVLGNLIMILTYLAWAIHQNPHIHLGWNLPFYFSVVVCGAAIAYNMRMLFAMISVVIVEATNIQFVWYQLYRLGTRPDILYPGFLRYLIMTAIPVAFIASVPARLLVEGFQFSLWMSAVAAASILTTLTAWCWRRVLREYASASS